MPATYKKIETITVGSGGQAAIEFLNIPQTYTDLKIVVSARGSDSNVYAQNKVRFNGATTDANLSYRNLYGNGASPTSQNGSLGFIADATGNTATSSTFSNTEIYIPNYTGGTNKSYSSDGVTENNATTAYAYLVAGLWSSISAITQISLVPYTGTYSQYSSATLYGILKA